MDTRDYSLFYVQSDTYRDGSFLTLYQYLRGNGGITLDANNQTITLSPRHLYQVAFMVQGQAAAGSYLQVAPYVGSRADPNFTATAQAVSGDNPISVTGSFFVDVPLQTFLSLQVHGALTGTLTGTLSIFVVNDL
ncbi:hypothetical protein [Anaeromassilibacillus senegalensis]|uniref:hypothetical protein n=1 Tax=Anaeromassilibacillus senegalensis TaxID=1673717 RepID=UPI00067F998F|nr:hypothetical protein [Anaeromassilibacillus senegalensis]